MLLKNNIFVRLFSYFTPYKISLFFAIVALFITAAAILSYGLLARALVDNISGGAFVDSHLFLKIFLIISLALSVSGFFRSYLINSISFKVIADLRSEIFSKCLNFPMRYFDNEGSGIVSQVVLKDLEDVFNLFTKNITFLLRNLFLFVASFILMVIVSVKLFMAMFISVIVLFFPIILLVKKYKESFSDFKDSNSNFSLFVSQSLHFIKFIKSSNAQDRLNGDIANLSSSLLKLFQKKIILQSLMVSVSILFSFTAIAVILYYGVILISYGDISIADFTSFIFNAVISSIAIVGLSQSLSQIIKISRNAKDSFAILNCYSEDLFTGSDLDLNHFKSISFKDVEFKYPCKDNMILKNISFKINLGDRVLINAPSGSGKSTIFSLMLKFYDYSSGVILLDDQSLNSFSIASIRKNIYFTMQDSFLLSASIYENLTFPNSKFSKNEILELISNEKPLQFINNLPQGIDTNIGSNGAKLSGGQKQRICILRALLSDANLLIFDESMSQLDSKNEQYVFDLIDRMRGDKTVIFVCHKSNNNLSFDAVIEL